jgi:hypothetical protein
MHMSGTAIEKEVEICATKTQDDGKSPKTQQFCMCVCVWGGELFE